MLRRCLLITGAIYMLVMAPLLIQHLTMDVPLAGLGAVAPRFHNYLENQRLQAPFRGSLKGRRLMYGPRTGDNLVWTAPLECNSGPDPELPNRYLVFLHRGYSLLEHKDIVRDLVDLDQAIDHDAIVSGEGGLYELFYSAHLNDTALAAVRADLGVDAVACERTIQLEAGWDSENQLTDEELELMIEYSDCVVRLDEIAAGAEASEDEKEILEQRCGPMPSRD